MDQDRAEELKNAPGVKKKEADGVVVTARLLGVSGVPAFKGQGSRDTPDDSKDWLRELYGF